MTSDPVLTNPPGLPAIAYRSGTQASVLRRMMDTLTSRQRALPAAAGDDPGLALLDAWATVADVVTFYQERIANEGYLGTATERRSVLELARSIGYELRPGVSAATLLDLRTEATATPATGPLAAPSRVVVGKGTRVLSVPGPGQLPQTFETDEEITLDAASDEISLVRSTLPALGTTTTELYLAGVATGLRSGDAILVVEDPRPDIDPKDYVYDLRVLRTVEPRPATGPDTTPATKVTWDDELDHAYTKPAVFAFGLRAALFGFNAPDWRALPTVVRRRYGKPPPPTADQLLAAHWPGFDLPDSEVIDLDAPYPDLGEGSLLALTEPGVPPRVYRVESAEPSAAEDFGISAKTTKVTLDRKDDVKTFHRREVTVLTRTRELRRAPTPLQGTVGSPQGTVGGPTATDLTLEHPAPLTAGRPVLVTGTRSGRPVVASARIRTADPPGNVTAITLEPALPEMDVDSVRIHGNVVPATHGETVPDEVLGSGDGSVANQRFTLNKPNVTHLPDPHAPGGVADSLKILIDGIEWTEVPSLYPAGPQDRVFVVRIDDDAVATVIFGDGEHGARLPTGQENVVARYRSGIGPGGEVGAHTLIVLPQRPPGVSSVDNPFPAGGASAPETLAEARSNAPLTVVTLDRVVAARDYEDFARAYGGIAKARASVVRGRTSTFLAVTVVGTGGKVVPPLTVGALRDALDARRDRGADVVVLGYETARFRVGVDVLAAPDRDRAVVEAAVKDAVRTAFAVDRRDFGQAVTPTEVTALVHGVPGVVACRASDLRLILPPPSPGDTPVEDIARVEEFLPARDARFAPPDGDPDRVLPAELLLVDPDAIDVGEMTP